MKKIWKSNITGEILFLLGVNSFMADFIYDRC